VLDYGFNYVPTVTLVEHFGPYWIENRCTYEQMRCDLLAMRAMNCRFVRFHLMPANPQRDSQPGADPVETPKEIRKAVEFARSLGLRVHYDIWAQDILNITEQEVREAVSEYKGLVESYQIGNEPYFCWSTSDTYYEHTQRLIAAGKAVDPTARFSIDIFPTDLAYLRKAFPELYATLDMIMIHFYAMSDHRGWSPVYIEQFVNYAGGKDNRLEELKDEKFIQIEFYPGSYSGFDKEIWITETTVCGFHRYAGQTPEDVKSRNWEDVCLAIAQRTNVTTFGHHCLRDKMSWREFGTSQCGVLYVDGSPKPVVKVFRDMAGRSLPDADLAKWVKVSLTAEGDTLSVHVENALDRDLNGTLTWAGMGSMRADSAPLAVSVPGGGEIRREIRLRRYEPTRDAASQVFCQFRASAWDSEFDNVVGWVSVRREQEFRVEALPEPLQGVTYVGGVDAVRSFFARYPNPAIITGGLIDFDAEMAYRLKSVIQAKSGLAVDTAATVNAGPLLDRPLVIVGNPQRNYYAKLIQTLAPPECRVSETNRCFVAVIEQPFRPHQWASEVANAIGYAYSPACLYVAGIDERTLQRATYDLIRRLWLDESVAVVDRRLGENPITGTTLRQFRVDLDPGDYRVSLLLGKAGAGNETIVMHRGKEVNRVWTDQSAQVFTFYCQAEDGCLTIGFNAKPGVSWALAGMEVAHAGLLADYRNFVFCTTPADEVVPQGALLVTPETGYTPERRFGWL
jgi:hypothetical protein